MTWLDRITSGVFRRFQSFWSDKLEWGGLVAYGAPTSSGVPVNEHKALALTAYYAGINVISTDVACLPIRLYRRRADGRGRDEIRDDRRTDLLCVTPDGETTAICAQQSWMGHALGWGNGYQEIEFTRGGEVKALHLLDPDLTRAERRSQDKKLFYRSGADTFPPYKVLHLAGLGFDGLSGYSPARLHREAIALGLATEAFGATFFGNGTNAEGVLETPQTLKGDALKNLRESIKAVHGGPHRAHRLMILEQGMKFSKTSVDPEDAQFLATRQFQVVEIARILRLPPHKIGDYTQSHLANIEAANLDYVITVLAPWCERMEQVLNMRLLTAEERSRGMYFEHVLNAILRGDMAARAEFYTKLLALGVFSTNDICGLENLNPVGPEGDRRFVSANLIPLDQAGQKPAAAPPAKAPEAAHAA